MSSITLSEEEEEDMWQFALQGSVCYSSGAVVGVVLVGYVGIPGIVAVVVSAKISMPF
jgi:hypothetical protein